MRFDYLNDSVPESLGRIRSLKAQKETHAPLTAIVTAILAIFAAWGIENYRLADARAAVASAEVRARDSRQELAKTKLVRVEVDRMLTLDRRLREVRSSGVTWSQRLTDIANHVPREAWFTSFTSEQGKIDINGHAHGLVVLSDTIAGLMSSKTLRSASLVRAGKDDGTNGTILSFEMRAQDKAR